MTDRFRERSILSIVRLAYPPLPDHPKSIREIFDGRSVAQQAALSHFHLYRSIRRSLRQCCAGYRDFDRHERMHLGNDRRESLYSRGFEGTSFRFALSSRSMLLRVWDLAVTMAVHIS